MSMSELRHPTNTPGACSERRKSSGQKIRINALSLALLEPIRSSRAAVVVRAPRCPSFVDNAVRVLA